MICSLFDDRWDRITEQAHPHDPTRQEVARFLAATGCLEYEIALRDRLHQLETHALTGTDILDHLGWLKRENARGAAVFIKPERHWILVDNISPEGVASLRDEGFEPCLTVHKGYDVQTWVELPRGRYTDAETDSIRREFQRRFGQSPYPELDSYSRLPGFTNSSNLDADPRRRYTRIMGIIPKITARARQLAAMAEEQADKQRHQPTPEREPRQDEPIKTRSRRNPRTPRNPYGP
ncbi:MAG: DNA-primase RepB domain-containing protein [Acidobacteriota bacterium]|nr:DNA-primase RepB domain-containing protein [Acidobacteriota bacterium]